MLSFNFALYCKKKKVSKKSIRIKVIDRTVYLNNPRVTLCTKQNKYLSRLLCNAQ